MATRRGVEEQGATKLLAIRVFGTVAVCAAVAVAAVALVRAPATAAPGIDASAPLTITRKPPSSLSAAPGIRLSKIASEEGSACYRASRGLTDTGRTISETFCVYE